MDLEKTNYYLSARQSLEEARGDTDLAFLSHLHLFADKAGIPHPYEKIVTEEELVVLTKKGYAKRAKELLELARKEGYDASYNFMSLRSAVRHPGLL